MLTCLCTMFDTYCSTFRLLGEDDPLCLWDCLWASSGLPVASRHNVENGCPEAQDGVIMSVVWPLPSDLASGIKWAWLESLHFTDDFDVVLVSICFSSAHTLGSTLSSLH